VIDKLLAPQQQHWHPLDCDTNFRQFCSPLELGSSCNLFKALLNFKVCIFCFKEIEAYRWTMQTKKMLSVKCLLWRGERVWMEEDEAATATPRRSR
jgi:hypothetical protein